jgi:glycosyltransferase involved in cell wall biosynthesis
MAGETLSRSLISIVRAVGRYDVVHFHATGPGGLSWITRALGQPSVVTFHALDQRREKWGLLARSCLTLGERLAVGNSDEVTVVSQVLRRYFAARHDIRATFVPNGMPLNEPRPPGAFMHGEGLTDRRYVLFASRLTPEKGCHDLINAFQSLNTDAALVIAGAGSAAGYIDHLKAISDPKRVIFVGHRKGEELAELFTSAALFVLPSYLEGMSMALLEAKCYRLPTLVSDIQENRDVMGSGAAYFPPRDVPALAATLGRLLGDAALLTELAEASRSVVLPDWDDVARRYDAIYRQAAYKGAGITRVPQTQ